MERTGSKPYLIGFIPYALAAFLVGIIGGFTTVLGPAFVKDLGLDYNNTTWTALAEIACVALGIVAVAFLPTIHRGRENIGEEKG